MLSDLGKQVDHAFVSFAKDYHKVWKSISNSPSRGLGATDLDQLNAYVEKRITLLNNQLANSMGRLRGASSDLIPTVQGTVFEMQDRLTSISSVAEAKGSGRMIGWARDSVRGAQRDFVLAGINDGTFYPQKGHL